MATKEQERKALNKIREILGTIDSDGWVNTAFAGICDIAESNIDNDFGDSPVEHEKDLKVNLGLVRTELKEVKDEISRLTSENDEYKSTLSKAVEKKDKCQKILNELFIKFEDDIEEANKIILEHCDNPDSIEFKEAVKRRQDAKAWLDKVSK